MTIYSFLAKNLIVLVAVVLTAILTAIFPPNKFWGSIFAVGFVSYALSFFIDLFF